MTLRNDKDAYEKMKDEYPDIEQVEVGPEHRYDNPLLLISIGVFFSVLMGMNSALDGGDVARNALVFFVAALSGGLSLIANKAAFHIGSKLAAAGDTLAILLVAGWFTLMAAVVGTIGFGGASRDLVSAAQLRAPIVAMTDASRIVAEAALDGNAVAPLLESAADDFLGVSSCERNKGCVSGRRGSGTVVASLENIAAKIRGVSRRFKTSDRRRSDLAKQLDALVSKYEEQLSTGGVSGESRAALLGIYTQAQSLTTELSGVVPTVAAAALVSEMRGLSVPAARRGRIDVGARLRKHAEQLETVLGTTKSERIALPPFPAPSGLAVGWERLDITWPLALVLFGLELILIVLWLLMVRDFRARRKAAVQQAARGGSTGHVNGSSDHYARRDTIGRLGTHDASNRDGDAS